MKAVMISIRPEWCEKIAHSKKTLELRKSFPKLELPFKCYIYCTKDKYGHLYLNDTGNCREEFPLLYIKHNATSLVPKSYINGMVIGEFICDSVLSHCEMANADLAEQMGCIRREKILEYSGGKEVFGWHISDLVIYDNPKKLSEFYVWKKCNSCRKSGYESTACGYDEDCKVPAMITRPPQSWCYVQEE